MRKIFLFMALCVSALCQAQSDITAKSLTLRGQKVDSVKKDTTGLEGRSRSLITAGAVYDFVAGRVIGSSSLQGVTDIGSNTSNNITVAYYTTIGSPANDYGGSIFMGQYAMGSMTTGFANTATGYGSMYATTTGSRNTAYGSQTLSDNTTGYENTAIGTQAMFQNTTGFGNVAVGRNAMQQNLDGSLNTGIGYLSLYYNSTGSMNAALGTNSLRFNTSGGNNLAAGVGAMENNTTGSYNVALGNNALLSNVGGGGNIGIGWNGMANNVNGINNIGIGYGAGKSVIGGDNNIFLGRDAGWQLDQLATVTGSIGIGHQAYTFKDSQIVLGASYIKEIIINSTDSAKWKGLKRSTSTSWLNAYDSATGNMTFIPANLVTGSSGIVVGTTTVGGGSTGNILYNNAGVVGEYITVGSGAVMRSTSPSVGTSLITANPSFDLLNTVATTVNAFGAAGNLNMGGSGTIAATLNLFHNTTASGNTKTLNIGTGAASGSTTAVNIGSATSGATNNIKINVTPASDASGDMYYRNASGFLTRIAIGTSKQTLHVVGGVPTWVDTAAIISTPVGTYSTRIGLTPSNGSEFFQTDDGRDAPAGKYFYLNSRWESLSLNATERMKYIFDDLLSAGVSNTISGSHYYSYNGTITNVNNGLRFSTATGATARVVIHQGINGTASGWIIPSEGVVYYKSSIIDLPILSTGAEEYSLRIGLGDMVLGADFQNGLYVEYDRTASTNWRYKTASAGTRTSNNSSVAVTTGSHIVEILYTPSNTTAEFWIDGTSLGTITTNIPTAAVGTDFQIVKSVGTTARTIDVDYIKTWQRLTTSRN